MGGACTSTNEKDKEDKKKSVLIEKYNKLNFPQGKSMLITKLENDNK